MPLIMKFCIHCKLIANLLQTYCKLIEGLEFKRLANCQTNGTLGVHRLLMLGSDSLFLIDGSVWSTPDLIRRGKSVHNIHSAPQFLCESILIRDFHQTIQKGLRFVV
jgi:hypothetical protein